MSSENKGMNGVGGIGGDEKPYPDLMAFVRDEADFTSGPDDSDGPPAFNPDAMSPADRKEAEEMLKAEKMVGTGVLKITADQGLVLADGVVRAKYLELENDIKSLTATLKGMNVEDPNVRASAEYKKARYSILIISRVRNSEKCDLAEVRESISGQGMELDEAIFATVASEVAKKLLISAEVKG